MFKIKELSHLRICHNFHICIWGSLCLPPTSFLQCPPHPTTAHFFASCILLILGHLYIIFIFINLFIYLFLAALGLHCCVRAFSSCASGGYSLLQCVGFSLWWLLLLRSAGSRRAGFSSCTTRSLEHRLSSCGAQGLVAPWHVESSRTKARTRVPCIGRRIRNHCATREVPVYTFKPNT